MTEGWGFLWVCIRTLATSLGVIRTTRTAPAAPPARETSSPDGLASAVPYRSLQMLQRKFLYVPNETEEISDTVKTDADTPL